jgi:soluble lytic murein transglycosylase-like protein
MAKHNYHTLMNLLTLCTMAGFAASAQHARADVFEMNADGQWQQINQKPKVFSEPFVEEDGANQDKLPAVRLAAITTLGEPVTSGQTFALSTRSITGQHATLINAAAKQFGISPALVEAVMWQESRYNHRAVSRTGAIGLMQLMPGTARGLGVNPHDPWQNVFGGAAYLRQQLNRFNNNVPFALAAYNAGPGAVIKYGGIPPYKETQNYVSVIMRRLKNQGQ